MSVLNLSRLFALTINLALAALLCAATALASPKPTRVLEVSYSEGELISLISIITKPGEQAAEARTKYIQGAFGLATTHGMKVLGSLVVTDVLYGEFKPQALAFYSWPSMAAEQTFDAQPEWKPIKETRPEGWDDLRIFDKTASDSVTMRFASDKYYTLATAWVNPERPDDYDNYLKRIEPAMNAVGGRFVYQMTDPAFAALVPSDTAPSRLTFVEWDTEDGLDRFLQSDGFQEHSNLLTSGTRNFELVRLAVSTRG
ncbi:MAG: DUF1330 domain-containing protein [Pseudomonadota bacterium]